MGISNWYLPWSSFGQFVLEWAGDYIMPVHKNGCRSHGEMLSLEWIAYVPNKRVRAFCLTMREHLLSSYS